MTRSVSSTVRFDCDYQGCLINQSTEGPLPKGWGELSINQKVADRIENTKTETFTPEQWATNSFHLCPDHVPPLLPE